jgi:hypothetical protein
MRKKNLEPAPELEPDQVAFDEQMARMTPEETAAMVKGLTALARSSVLREPHPTPCGPDGSPTLQ